MAAVALALALVAAPRTPFEALAHQHGFRVAHYGVNRREGDWLSRLSYGEKGHQIALSSGGHNGNASSLFHRLIDGMNAIPVHPCGARFNVEAFDGAPIGVVVPVIAESALVRFADLVEGQPVQSVWTYAAFLAANDLVGSILDCQGSNESLSHDVTNFDPNRAY